MLTCSSSLRALQRWPTRIMNTRTMMDSECGLSGHTQFAQEDPFHGEDIHTEVCRSSTEEQYCSALDGKALFKEKAKELKGEESEEPAREILQGFKGRSEGRLQKKFEVLKSRFSVWKGKLKMVLKAKKEAAPQDPSFGKTFASLGYFINKQNQIRSIDDPTQRYHFHWSSNDRYVERRKQAMDDCIRAHITTNLIHRNNMEMRNVPSNATEENGKPHIKILVSRNIERSKRVIVFVGEASQPLGTLSGRLINEKDICFGSYIDWVTQAQKTDFRHEIGIVIANVGELVWCKSEARCMTQNAWYALPRESGVSLPYEMTSANVVERNEDAEAHIRCVFQDILGPLVKQGPLSIDCIGIAQTGNTLVRFLQKDWSDWGANMSSIVTLGSFIFAREFFRPEFHQFYVKRCRTYIQKESDQPAQFVYVDQDRYSECPIISAGEEVDHIESIFPFVHQYVSDYFKMLCREPGYTNDSLVRGAIIPQVEERDNVWWKEHVGLMEYTEVESAGSVMGTPPVTEAVHAGEAEEPKKTISALSPVQEATESAGSVRNSGRARGAALAPGIGQTHRQIRPTSGFTEFENASTPTRTEKASSQNGHNQAQAGSAANPSAHHLRTNLGTTVQSLTADAQSVHSSAGPGPTEYEFDGTANEQTRSTAGRPSGAQSMRSSNGPGPTEYDYDGSSNEQGPNTVSNPAAEKEEPQMPRRTTSMHPAPQSSASSSEPAGTSAPRRSGQATAFANQRFAVPDPAAASAPRSFLSRIEPLSPLRTSTDPSAASGTGDNHDASNDNGSLSGNSSRAHAGQDEESRALGSESMRDMRLALDRAVAFAQSRRGSLASVDTAGSAGTGALLDDGPGDKDKDKDDSDG